MATTSPMWAETSVRWLREKRPEYVATSSSLPFPRQLVAALNRMSYKQYEWVTLDKLSMKEYKAQLSEIVNTWNSDDHARMVAFIMAGGYAAVAVAAELEATPPEPVTVAVADSDGKIVGKEVISIVMDELDELETEMKPVSQHSPEHELDEIVADAARESDDRYGAW